MKKSMTCLSVLLFSILVLTGCENMIKAAAITNAVYLGVENYGAGETNKDNKDTFSYRFMINGREKTYKVDNGERDSDGNYEYPIQNILKEAGMNAILSISVTRKYTLSLKMKMPEGSVGIPQDRGF